MRDLPMGTVTFLFTDVEGSTKLLHELGPQAYADALAGHRRVIRDACGAGDGVEVDTQGDAFFFAFPTAPGALAAASAFTDALASGPIQVRVGLHTGTPLLTEEGYVGDDVHFAARVAAAGHGGQILLSKDTAVLLDGAALSSLGSHRLKDVQEPVTIYQLGERAFPRLKTIANSNLPTPTSSFLGREDELYEADLELQRTRLLTVTGPGGAGKTRFALELATRVREERFRDHEDGVYSAFLSSLRDPQLVPVTIAVSLAVREQPAQSVQEALASHLQGKKVLLLLDNLEHLPGAFRELAELLSACPGLTLLCTSRERLRLQGERAYELPPLREEESLSLFCERAQTEPTDDIRELCARLEGLPLAIELAAARTSVLTPQQILTRLSQRLDFLKGGPDRDPRQETLRATIEWSHELLSPEEQQLFSRLAVFSGGCTLEAAEEVCDADIDSLQSLVDKSLVRFTDGRYWLLETIREYAGERLEQAGEAQEIRRGFALYFADLGPEAGDGLKGPEQEAWLQRLDADRANLLQSFGELDPSIDGARMLGFAGYGLWVFLRGLHRHLLDALDEALRHSRADSDHHLRALYVAASCATVLGRLDRASALASDLLAEARRSGEREDLLRALDVTVGVALEFERFEEARTYLDESLTLALALGNPVRLTDVFARLARIALETGEWDEAVVACKEALALRADLPDTHVSLTLTQLAFALAIKNDASAALDACEESLELEWRLADAIGVAYALLPIAYVTACSDPECAATLVRAVSELTRLHGFALERFEMSVYEQTCDLVEERIGRGVLDAPRANIGLESAVDLGRRAIARSRSIGDRVGH